MQMCRAEAGNGGFSAERTVQRRGTHPPPGAQAGPPENAPPPPPPMAQAEICFLDEAPQVGQGAASSASLIFQSFEKVSRQFSQ